MAFIELKPSPDGRGKNQIHSLTFKAIPLFNSTREPWYKWVPRAKKTDILGYITRHKFQEQEKLEIHLVPNWDEAKGLCNFLESEVIPYDVMLYTTEEYIFKSEFLVRLGTVFISKTDETEGNEQTLLESIMSDDDIKMSLDWHFKNRDRGI
jgi:hypothetical protein